MREVVKKTENLRSGWLGREGSIWPNISRFFTTSLRIAAVRTWSLQWWVIFPASNQLFKSLQAASQSERMIEIDLWFELVVISVAFQTLAHASYEGRCTTYTSYLQPQLRRFSSPVVRFPLRHHIFKILKIYPKQCVNCDILNLKHFENFENLP